MFLDKFVEMMEREFNGSMFGAVKSAIESASSAAYHGQLNIQLENSSNTVQLVTPTLNVYVKKDLNWGNGWMNTTYNGYISWTTSSGHFVQFVLSQKPNDERVYICAYKREKDDSETFYPTIDRLMKENNIPQI